MRKHVPNYIDVKDISSDEVLGSDFGGAVGIGERVQRSVPDTPGGEAAIPATPPPCLWWLADADPERRFLVSSPACGIDGS